MSDERDCPTCRGIGAREIKHEDGEPVPERVKDIRDHGMRKWYLRRGIGEDEIAPCPTCMGVGHVTQRRTRQG